MADTAIVLSVPPAVFSTVLTAICAGLVYVVKKTVNTGETLSKHEATDEINFRVIRETLAELKEAQSGQTTKLDRLMEHMIVQPPATSRGRSQRE